MSVKKHINMKFVKLQQQVIKTNLDMLVGHAQSQSNCHVWVWCGRQKKYLYTYVGVGVCVGAV